jgi:hypothetical protein
VSFYIFNSKLSEKTFWLLMALTILACHLVLNTVLSVYLSKRTTQDTFVEEKSSKIQHLAMQPNSHRLDSVFIGDSTTVYHISQAEMKKAGLSTYNLGISGNSILDYPYLLSAVYPLKPRSVVINISIAEFFSRVEESQTLNLVDLLFFREFFSTSELVTVGKQVLTNTVHFYRLREAIYSTLVNRYRQFNRVSTVVASGHEAAPVVLTADCMIFNKKIFQHAQSGMCANGDGVMYGQYHFKKIEQWSFDKLNAEYVAILNKLITEIEANGVMAIVVLQPVNFGQKRDAAIVKKITDQLQGRRVIDNSSFELSVDMWADSGHLNVQGRSLYSQYFSAKLKQMMMR